MDPYAIDWSDTEPLELDDPTSIEDDASDTGTLEMYDKITPKKPFINTGYVVYPVYGSSGVQTYGGLDFMYYFRRTGERRSSLPCYIRTFFAAGNKEYARTGLAFNNYWRNEKYNLLASFYYQRRMAGLFDTGTYTPLYFGQYRASDFNSSALFRMKFNRFSYVGVKYDFIYNDETLNIIRAINSGLGIFWNNTPVEPIFSPSTKFVFDISATLYSRAFGSSSDFGRYVLNFKEYLNVYNGHILLLEFYSRFHSGHVPYRQLASPGELFMAYSQDKYKGRQMMAVKAEYRLPIITRTHLTAFLGTSYLSNEFSKFRMNNNLPSYGGGVLFLIYKELNINARMDIVSGRDGSGIWFGIGEGF